MKNRIGAPLPVTQKTIPPHLAEAVSAWRERELKLAVKMMAELLTDELYNEFWRRFELHAPLLNPPPPGCVVEGVKAPASFNN